MTAFQSVHLNGLLTTEELSWLEFRIRVRSGYEVLSAFSGQILLWDLEKENEEPFQDPDGHLPHIQGIKSVRPSVINFNDVQWDAPAIDAVLVDKDKRKPGFTGFIV